MWVGPGLQLPCTVNTSGNPCCINFAIMTIRPTNVTLLHLVSCIAK